MEDSRVALRYAKGILDVAKESKLESKVNDDMLLIASTISESDDLKAMLASPIIRITQKIKVLKSLFEEKVNKLTLGLFHLLQYNKRISILLSITKQYSIIFDFLKHVQIAKVITAVPLTKEIEEQIYTKIIELTGEKADLENVISPAILGGFILRVGDVQYDASISNYLNELRKEFDNSHYIPKI